MQEATEFNLLEALYNSMQDENAISETFGDLDPEAMASVFADYEANKQTIIEFFTHYGPLLGMNGFDVNEVYREVMQAIKEM
jgi:hypothetical protein